MSTPSASSRFPSGPLISQLTGLLHIRRELRAGTDRMADYDFGRFLKETEAEVKADPESCFRFNDEGYATLTVAGESYQAGRFETPTIAELRQRVGRNSRPRGRARLSVLAGRDPLTDIGTLQAFAGEGSLFQVASQFNTLESPGSYLSPVARYISDSTQGPRAAISALPGVLLRHYQAPGAEGRYAQSQERQINLLADALPERVATVESGYLQGRRVHQPERLAAVLEENFEDIRVGLHDGIEVLFGYDWNGPVPQPRPLIGQVCSSTLAMGFYSSSSGDLLKACRPLLRAAYLGTFLGALALGRQQVFLTLIGGGVFGNPHEEIWDAIEWALEETDGLGRHDLNVVVSLFSGLGSMPRERVAEALWERGGAIIGLERGQIVIR